MKILIQREGVQQGPYSSDAVRSLIAEGSILPTALARRDDGGEWVPLESLLGTANDTIPPSRTSNLVTWSLVLGFLGFVTLGITSIGAIICGHLSRGKIRDSRGLLTGKGIAMAGLILGYTCLILIGDQFFFGNPDFRKAKNVISLATAVAIETAVNNFYTEYGSMPSETEITDTSQDASLVKTLLGDDPTRSTRTVRFLAVREAKNNRGGLDPATSRISDPWGHGYQVILDTKYAEVVTVTRGGIRNTLKGRRVAVFSVGKDGIAGTADDVTTW